MVSRLIVTHLSHDLQARKSFVSYVWADDPSKRLGLEVPFDTSLDQVDAAAKAALVALADELKSAELNDP